MFELARVQQWLTSVLSNDPTLQGLATGGFHEDPAPHEISEPVVVFSPYGEPPDVRVLGPYRVMIDADYLVKAISRDPSAVTAVSIADRVDTLLDGAKGNAGGVSILCCVRQRSVSYKTEEFGVVYQHRGGIYRILAQEG